MIRALLFDLDDTLYCENDFLVSGYRAVAESVAPVCRHASGDIHSFMLATLAREGRQAVLGAVLERFPDSGFQVADLVDIYRHHVPAISLFPGYAGLLRELRASYRIGIITDGVPEVQKSKCAALGLTEISDSILCTWENGRDREKPHPYPFLQMLDRLRVTPDEALFIGDNPDKDIRGARGVGMKSVHVIASPLTRSVRGETEADFAVESLTQLPLILRQLEGQDDGL